MEQLAALKEYRTPAALRAFVRIYLLVRTYEALELTPLDISSWNIFFKTFFDFIATEESERREGLQKSSHQSNLATLLIRSSTFASCPF